MKLLIIEDDKFCQDILGNMAKDLSIEYELATNYSEACTLIELNPGYYDIVVTDFNFPGGNGNVVATLARDCGINTIILFSSSNELTPSFFDHIIDKDFLKLRRLLADYKIKYMNINGKAV